MPGNINTTSGVGGADVTASAIAAADLQTLKYKEELNDLLAKRLQAARLKGNGGAMSVSAAASGAMLNQDELEYEILNNTKGPAYQNSNVNFGRVQAQRGIEQIEKNDKNDKKAEAEAEATIAAKDFTTGLIGAGIAVSLFISKMQEGIDLRKEGNKDINQLSTDVGESMRQSGASTDEIEAEQSAMTSGKTRKGGMTAAQRSAAWEKRKQLSKKGIQTDAKSFNEFLDREDLTPGQKSDTAGDIVPGMMTGVQARTGGTIGATGDKAISQEVFLDVRERESQRKGSGRGFRERAGAERTRAMNREGSPFALLFPDSLNDAINKDTFDQPNGWSSSGDVAGGEPPQRFNGSLYESHSQRHLKKIANSISPPSTTGGSQGSR